MFKSISDIIENRVVSTRNYRRGNSFNETFDFFKLVERWSEVVGDRMAAHTAPVKIDRKALYIISNHSAFSQQISFMEEAIKANIFKAFPYLNKKINKIYFKVDSSYFNKVRENHSKNVRKDKVAMRSALPHKYSPEYRKLKAEADALFADQEDSEMKEILISIYIQQRHRE